MRTLIDVVCPGCGESHVDYWIDTAAPSYPRCARCDTPMQRHLRSHGGVKADGIPGGLWIAHGLCHPDGSPRRYDSHREIAREARARGLTNMVEHKPDTRGGDGSRQTQRFV